MCTRIPHFRPIVTGLVEKGKEQGGEEEKEKRKRGRGKGEEEKGKRKRGREKC